MQDFEKLLVKKLTQSPKSTKKLQFQIKQFQIQWLQIRQKYCQHFRNVHNKNFDLTLDKYVLKTKTVSFSDHKESLK